jgi:hypothetical protein
MMLEKGTCLKKKKRPSHNVTKQNVAKVCPMLYSCLAPDAAAAPAVLLAVLYSLVSNHRVSESQEVYHT